MLPNDIKWGENTWPEIAEAFMEGEGGNTNANNVFERLSMLELQFLLLVFLLASVQICTKGRSFLLL